MPVPYQIIPQGSMYRPKVETHINDNSVVNTSADFGGGTATAVMCVFTSPKGRDNQVITIGNGLTEFTNEFGMGPFSVYGQPLLNAYNAARTATTTNARLHCMRVMPADAAYSNVTLIAKYLVDSVAGTMKIRYVVKASDAEVTSLDDLETACTVDSTPDAEGYVAVKLFTMAYLGRGVYGKNIRFRVTNDSNTDKTNSFKNYLFGVYRNESSLELVENFAVTVDPDGVLNGVSVYLEDVIDDPDDGSSYIALKSFPETFTNLYNAYVTAKPDTTFTIADFDPLLGIDKYTKGAIAGLTIEPTADYKDTLPAGEIAVAVSDPAGISLLGGSDGALAIGNVNRETTLNGLYKDAFDAKLDPNIASKNRFPTTFIMDANFDVPTKLSIAALTLQRTDCMAMFDFGTGIYTRDSVLDYYNLNFAGVAENRAFTLEPYAMKVRDPYSQKAVTVTSTYWLCSAYLSHINTYGGKHVPLAGNRYGIMDNYITNSVYPIFDADLHSDQMDECADAKLNIASYNPSQVVVRDMQNTSQDLLSSLTEQSNQLVLLDVKRDCEDMASRIEYEFSDEDTLARFNLSLENITQRYSAAQVKSITATVEANDWEKERSILHLYVAMAMKDVVKTVIVEIDINRE